MRRLGLTAAIVLAAAVLLPVIAGVCDAADRSHFSVLG